VPKRSLMGLYAVPLCRDMAFSLGRGRAVAWGTCLGFRGSKRLFDVSSHSGATCLLVAELVEEDLVAGVWSPLWGSVKFEDDASHLVCPQFCCAILSL
jgi:hypothetical protein